MLSVTSRSIVGRRPSFLLAAGKALAIAGAEQPCRKRAKQHKEMLSAIRRGDKIVTSGGLTGTIVKVVEDSETVEIEIAKDVKVHVVRAMIADVKGKPQPAK